MTIRILPTIALSGLIGAAFSTAFGQTSVDPLARDADFAGGAQTTSQVVTYSDLNLTSPEGASTLVNRINSAAERTCSPAPVHGSSFADSADYQRCMRQATGHAVGGLDNRVVTYAYRRRQPER